MLQSDDLVLAKRHAPIICFDAAEPFLPTLAGYTVFRAPNASPSFPRYIALEPPAVLAVEYALWWDWDIQHLYELEHAWVFVDDAGSVVRVESSQHGRASGDVPHLDGGRPVLYAEPGKHALKGSSAELSAHTSGTEYSCNAGAGVGGVWVTPLYRDRIARTPDADQLVRTYLRRHAFTPRWEWSRRVDVAGLELMPWTELDTRTPRIVAERVSELEASIAREDRHVWHIGHRGAGVHAPPNTLASLAEAAKLGAHMVELDVRLNADGVPVLVHDAMVMVPGRGNVPVNALTVEELGTLGPAPDSGVPPLAEALDRCARLRLGPYLEIKEGPAVGPVVRELSSRDLARYSIVASFDPAVVARVTGYAPHMPTSILFNAFNVDPVALARGCGARYVHPCWERHPTPHTLLTPQWLADVRRAGLGIITWHEERPEAIGALLRLGVSGICTDRLDLLNRVKS